MYWHLTVIICWGHYCVVYFISFIDLFDYISFHVHKLIGICLILIALQNSLTNTNWLFSPYRPWQNVSSLTYFEHKSFINLNRLKKKELFKCHELCSNNIVVKVRLVYLVRKNKVSVGSLLWKKNAIVSYSIKLNKRSMSIGKVTWYRSSNANNSSIIHILRYFGPDLYDISVWVYLSSVPISQVTDAT